MYSEICEPGLNGMPQASMYPIVGSMYPQCMVRGNFYLHEKELPRTGMIYDDNVDEFISPLGFGRLSILSHSFKGIQWISFINSTMQS